MDGLNQTSPSQRCMPFSYIVAVAFFSFSNCNFYVCHSVGVRYTFLYTLVHLNQILYIIVLLRNLCTVNVHKGRKSYWSISLQCLIDKLLVWEWDEENFACVFIEWGNETHKLFEQHIVWIHKKKLWIVALFYYALFFPAHSKIEQCHSERSSILQSFKVKLSFVIIIYLFIKLKW